MRKRKRTSLMQRLRKAQVRATLAEHEARAAHAIVYRLTHDSGGVAIASNLRLEDVAETAARTARKLGFVVIVVPDATFSGTLQFRAIRPTE